MPRTEAINGLHDQLLKRRAALSRALDGDLSLLREFHQEKTGDLLDAAADSVQDELHGQLIEAESRELGQIDEAIGRFNDGTYGKCCDCGKNIPLNRLRAVPYASDCIDCRRLRERRSQSPTASLWSRKFDSAELDTV